jgi:asparagine synthase (glutamine-hydrolysing)
VHSCTRSFGIQLKSIRESPPPGILQIYAAHRRAAPKGSVALNSMKDRVHGINIVVPEFTNGPTLPGSDDGLRLADDAPYFLAWATNGRVDTRGVTECTLGHRITRPSGPPDGIFAGWAWDGTHLRVVNDRYGFYPLYYFCDNDRIAVSPSLTKLLTLGAPTELDEEGMAVFLRIGFFLGEHTPFKAIRALPPQVDFEWSHGKLRIAGRRPQATLENISRNEAIDRFLTALRTAIQRRLPQDGRCAIPLSGGRDSRLLTLMLREAGCPPAECVTVLHAPPLRNGDAICAAEVAAALQLKHVLLNQQRNRLNAELIKNVRTNMCSDEHTHYMVLADYLRQHFTTVYDGIGADTLTGFSTPGRLDAFHKDNLTPYVDYLLGAYPKRNSGQEDFLAQALWPSQYKRFSRELAVECLKRELSKHLDAPSPPISFFFWNRTRREITLIGFGIMKDIPNVFCPYLDHDVYDGLASLPVSLLLDLKFRSDAIARAFPKAAAIPYDVWAKAPNVHAQSYFRQFGRDLLWWIAARPAGPLIRRTTALSIALRSAISAESGKSLFASRWIGPHTVYLLQLESFLRQLAATDVKVDLQMAATL